MNLSDYEDSIKMGEIRYEKNKYYFIPIIKEGIKQINENEILTWFIFKGNKYPLTKNKYKIKEGDILKLGKVCLIVRGIHLTKKKFERKNTNCLISYHNKSNKSLNFNEYCDNDYSSEYEDKNSDDNSNSNNNSSSNCGSDICDDEEENVKKIIKITKKNSKKKIKIRKKSDDTTLINDNKSKKINNIKKSIKKKATYNHLNTIDSIKSEKQKICRICYMTETDSKINPLIKPCKCSGSMKYIHYKCLLHWLKTKITVEKVEYFDNHYFSLYSSENVQCELCKENLPHFIKHKNRYFNLTELEQNFDNDLKLDDNKNKKENKDKSSDNNYVVLDTISTDDDSPPLRYIAKFSKNNILKIGRGLDMNLIMNDLSISRNHCQLQISENGKIYLQDNDSKFGTLVLVQTKAIEILKGQILTIQVGRTFFNISYKKNFSFFSCCEAEEIDKRKTYEKINNKSVKVSNHCVVLTESESEKEECIDSKRINNDKHEKIEENEYEKVIKNINNKKIKIEKIKIRNGNSIGQEDTNFKSNKDIILNNENKDINIKENLKKENTPIKRQKSKKRNSKKKLIILDNKENENNNQEKNNIINNDKEKEDDKIEELNKEENRKD